MNQLILRGQNESLIKLLLEKEVEFLIIGGYAAFFYNCREDFNDLDILLNNTLANTRKFVSCVYNLHPDIVLNENQLTKSSVQLPLKDKGKDIDIDVLTPAIDEDYGELYDHSTNWSLDWRSVRVVGKSDLIKMKEKTIAKLSSEVEKHAADLECLKSK